MTWPPRQSVPVGYPHPSPPYPAAPYAGGYPPPYPGFVSPRPGPKNELGIASLWFGIFAGAFFWFPVIGLVLGIIAVATGFSGLWRIKRGVANNTASAVTGIVLGVLTSIVGLVIVLGIGYLFYGFITYENCIDHAEGRGAYAQC